MKVRKKVRDNKLRKRDCQLARIEAEQSCRLEKVYVLESRNIGYFAGNLYLTRSDYDA
jgi:hypothetical protein